jgi:hypothetical protein
MSASLQSADDGADEDENQTDSEVDPGQFSFTGGKGKKKIDITPNKSGKRTLNVSGCECGTEEKTINVTTRCKNVEIKSLHAGTKITNNQYIPIDIKKEQKLELDVKAIPSENTELPPDAIWQYRANEESEWKDGPKLTSNSIHVKKGGTLLFRGKCETKTTSSVKVFIIDELKIKKKVDTVVKGIDKKLGKVEVLGADELLPDPLRKYIDIKIDAPDLNRDDKQLTLSSGQAEITFEASDIVPSDSVLGSEIKAILEGANKLEGKIKETKEFTAAVIEDIKDLSEQKFRPGESTTLTVSIAPSAVKQLAKAQEKLSRLLDQGLEVTDTLGTNLDFGSVSVVGTTPKITIGPDLMNQSGQAKVKVNKQSKFYEAYKELRDFSDKYSTYKSIFLSVPSRKFYNNPLEIDFKSGDKDLKIKGEISPADQRAKLSSDFLNLGVLAKNDDGEIVIQAHANQNYQTTFGEDGNLNVNFGLQAKSTDGDFTSAKASGSVEVGQTYRNMMHESFTKADSRKAATEVISDAKVRFETVVETSNAPLTAKQINDATAMFSTKFKRKKDILRIGITSSVNSAISNIPREENVSFSADQSVVLGYKKVTSSGIININAEGTAELNSLFQEDRSKRFAVSPSVSFEGKVFENEDNIPTGFIQLEAKADFFHETDVGASSNGNVLILFEMPLDQLSP